MVFMNTNVTRGSGSFVVTSTGMATEVGHISHMLQSTDDADTPLTIQLKKLTSQILVIAGAAVAVSVVLNLSRGESFDTVFTAAIAFAISAIPTGLPAVVTTILSYGTQMLAKANAIMKRLRSTETLGSTSAINSDKTGTLTLNQMTAVEMTIPGRRYTISGGGYATEGTIKHVFGPPEVPLEQFLLPMALCADAVVKDGGLVGDPTEGALVVLAEKGGLDAVETRRAYPRVAELPFDSAYKMMATFHEMQRRERPATSSAASSRAPRTSCSRARRSGRLPRTSPSCPSTTTSRSATWTRTSGSRARACASWRPAGRTSIRARFDPSADLLPLLDGMTVLALVGIVDPPRPAAKAAIAIAHEAGIRVRMITGDHVVTAVGDRGRARHPRPRDQRRGVQGDVRRRARQARSTRSA